MQNKSKKTDMNDFRTVNSVIGCMHSHDKAGFYAACR